jgi:hypothetical protein
VEVTSENVHVLKRENVRRFIETRNQSGTSFFSQSDIEAIYKKLLPQMQVSEVVKAQHLQTIQQKYKN